MFLRNICRGGIGKFIKRPIRLCHSSHCSNVLLVITGLLGAAGNSSTMTYGIIPSRPPCSHSVILDPRTQSPIYRPRGNVGWAIVYEVAGWILKKRIFRVMVFKPPSIIPRREMRKMPVSSAFKTSPAPAPAPATLIYHFDSRRVSYRVEMSPLDSFEYLHVTR